MTPPEPDPVDRLPHRPPALLLTSASLPGNGTCLGVREPDPKGLLVNAAGFFPDSLLMELMAQTAGLILPEESAGAYVAGIREMHLHRAASGDERVEVQARLNRSMGKIFIFDCRAEASGTLLAHGSIILRVV